MVCIEFTLNLNHMQNVVSFPGASPGQLIPLLIGITSLLRVSYIILRNRRPWERIHIHRLGLTFSHTKNTYSPPGKDSPTNPEETAHLPSNDATTDPSPPPGHLLHRALFTWLPWLNLFSSSSPRHSFTLLHSRASSGGGGVTMHDSNVSYDEMRSRRSPKPTMGEMENADVPLIQFTPPQQHAGAEWEGR
jgi:hypothetical protein